jgi:DnaJ-class molecular chaperone
MMTHPIEEIENALEVLNLPRLISKADVKKQFRFLAKKYHPDKGGDAKKMEELNDAYAILMEYIEGFRYTFDAEEISKQCPQANHTQRFRP